MTRPPSDEPELAIAAEYLTRSLKEFSNYLKDRYPNLSMHGVAGIAAAIIGALPSLYEENPDSPLSTQLDELVDTYIASFPSLTELTHD